MAVTVVEKNMLSCPKCNSTYQEGTQRFCTNDGSRLVSSTISAKSAGNSAGVFTSLIGRSSSNSENDERIAPRNPSSNSPQTRTEAPTFHTTFSSKVFKDDNLAFKKDEAIHITKPAVRLVKPNEIASGTAEVGNRKLNPTGRLALTWENPKILLGQTIKGRYYITEKLYNDDSSITFLADDKIIAHKQVTVRVLMDEKHDDLLSKIFAEERVSLSHMNHPNIVSVLDSGELLEGLPFVVAEYVDGFTLKEKLNKLEQFNPQRTARIIRQASNALSEAHQNGILHRSIKPANIFLTVSEVGTELVKVSDFVVANGAKRNNLDNAKYLSPEQLEGKMPNFASDIYSMAVVAYQMLIGKMPFDFATADQLLKAQRAGFTALPSKIRADISPAVDDIFIKALAYDSTERYPKARDFGDALFHALSESHEVHEEIETVNAESNAFTAKIGEKITLPSTSILIPSSKEARPLRETNQITIEANHVETFETIAATKEIDDLPITLGKGELAWERRSPDPVEGGKTFWLIIAAVGLIALSIMAYLGWKQFMNRSETPDLGQNNPIISEQTTDTPVTEINQPDKPQGEIESPPLARNWTQPQNTEYFENTKMDVKGDLSKNYRGFKLAYPKTWAKTASATNFLDVSRKTENGSLMEQMLVTHYASTGLFSKDKTLFPKLVEKSNKDLKAALGSNYKVVSQGETKIQNGRWSVYEVKFQSSGLDANGKPVTVWGRRFWLPTQNPTMRNGFVITMLATSLSANESADDVGNKDELAGILESFEPSTLD